ncbi:MAG TPA: prolyl oligopeptidase family serine peptidase [Streptosporangiaceae bacterium]|jgi:dipeptidyl-peptidase-4
MTTSFPRQFARTRRFTLGAPRAFRIAPGGERVLFLRSPAGDDPQTCLWELDLDTGTERIVADPRTLGDTHEDLPPEERARRERLRETAGGIVAYACDADVRRAVFPLSGRVYLADLLGGAAPRLLETAGPVGMVIDPRLDPTGARMAYVSEGALHVLDLDGGADRVVAEPDGPEVTWGLAEFIAAEEMQRYRGYWWAPDGRSLLVARVDEEAVPRRYIADPANPGKPPNVVAYPAAGTVNAQVTLWVVGLDGERVQVPWNNIGYEYLVTADWDEHGPRAVVQSRDQRNTQILEIDPESGASGVLRSDHDPVWLDNVPGVPGITESGDLVWTADADDTKRLIVGSEPVTPPGLQVDSVLDVDGDTILFAATDEPTELYLWTYGPDGLRRLTDEPGVYMGRRTGGTTVVAAQSLDYDGVLVRVLRGAPGEEDEVARIDSHAVTPPLTPRVELLRAGEREIRTALLLPTGYDPASGPLPVLLDPYGGPHALRVRAARRAYLEGQWLADQGFAVVIADGRGTPMRGAAWDRSVRGDLLTPVLEDQIAALEGAARSHPGVLDTSRVGIRGWSFGGYLAAAAVLRHPDVFHAAVAGAPVTEQELYDTHYTERYLGHPDEEPDNYARCSLLPDAPKLSRPLLLIHGLADDNVLVAHTLRLSSALLAAGRPHTLLPLSGVTHMTPQEVVAENLLLLQVDFLTRALG